METPLNWWQRSALKEVLTAKLEFESILGQHADRFIEPIRPENFRDENYTTSDVERMTDEQLVACCFPPKQGIDNDGTRSEEKSSTGSGDKG